MPLARIRIAIVVVLSVIVAGVSTRALAQGAADERAVAQVIADRQVAWNAGDPEAYRRLLTPDADLSSSSGQIAPESSRDIADVLALDQRIADAVVRGDTAFVRRATSADFVMVHGDGWTNGGRPLSTDTQESMLRRVEAKHYDVLDFDSVRAEMHGDVAITYGRYIAHVPSQTDQATQWFSVWFQRVFAKRDGRWVYLSHRTVHGPTYGPNRASVQDR